MFQRVCIFKCWWVFPNCCPKMLQQFSSHSGTQVPTAFLYLLISYLSPYWKKQNQNFTGFGSLDLIHFLGHGPVFTCLICPISIKPLAPADPSLFLLWPLSLEPSPSISCLSYLIRNSISHNFSLLTVFLPFLTFFPALWLISQFRILLPPVHDLIHFQFYLNLSPYSPS